MKSVIIYTYYQSEHANYNLRFFVKKELTYKENIDYIVVINGYEYDSSIIFPEIDNLTVIKRENIGFDFGGHKAALDFLDKNNQIYDYYFFMNSGVFGPILSPSFTENHWSNVFIKKINDVVKLVGTTIVCLPPWDDGKPGPKVEGFFFMTDSIGLDVLKKEETIFCNHPSFHNDVVYGEYGLSNCIFKNGYSIDCMLKRYEGIDWKDPCNHNMNDYLHPSRKNSFYGGTIDPYEVIFYKWFWKYEGTVNFDIIEAYCMGQSAFP
jgi:hypothetical protein